MQPAAYYSEINPSPNRVTSSLQILYVAIATATK